MEWQLNAIDKDIPEILALLTNLETSIVDFIGMRKLDNRNNLMYFKKLEHDLSSWIRAAMQDCSKEIYRFRSLETRLVGEDYKEVPVWLDLSRMEYAWLLIHRIIGCGDSEFKTVLPYSCPQSGWALHLLLLEDFQKVFKEISRPRYTRQLRSWGDYATAVRFVEDRTLVKCSEGIKIEMFSVVVRLGVPPGFSVNECSSLKEMISSMKTLKVTETEEYIEFELLFISNKKVDAIGVAYCHLKTLEIFKECFDDWINVEDGGSDARNCERFTLLATSAEFEKFRDSGEHVTTVADHSAARVDGTHRTVYLAFEVSFLNSKRRNPMFRFPTDAKSIVEYAKEHLSKPKDKERKVKWRFFEYVDNQSADFLRHATNFTYTKKNQLVDKMQGINDLHRFKFSANKITAYKTFTKHDKPTNYCMFSYRTKTRIILLTLSAQYAILPPLSPIGRKTTETTKKPLFDSANEPKI